MSFNGVTTSFTCYYISWKNFQLSAFWSSKIGEYEYLTGGEILPSSQRQIMQQVNNKQIMQQAPFF